MAMKEDDLHSCSTTTASGRYRASSKRTWVTSSPSASATSRNSSSAGGSSSGDAAVRAARGPPRGRLSQARDDRRVGAKRDRVAGRERPAVVRHRQVLVKRSTALERDVVDGGGLLRADREDHEAGRIGKLAPEPRELARIAVGDLVVHGDPAVPRRRHDRRLGAKDPRDESRDRLDDGCLIVGLEVHRAVRAGRSSSPASADRSAAIARSSASATPSRGSPSSSTTPPPGAS